jgi:hypothetical protein
MSARAAKALFGGPNEKDLFKAIAPRESAVRLFRNSLA